jgi:hypothetical protein
MSFRLREDCEVEISVAQCEGTPFGPCPGYRWAITTGDVRILEFCDMGDEYYLKSSAGPGSTTYVEDVTGYTREEFLELARG